MTQFVFRSLRSSINTGEMSRLFGRGAAEGEVTLRWKQLAERGMGDVVLEGGSATQVGSRVFFAGGAGRLSVVSCEGWTVEELGSPLLRLPRWHIAQLVDDKIFFCGGLGSMSLVEYDVVLGHAREVVTDEEIPIGKMYMTSVYAPWRKEIVTFGGFVSRNRIRSNETHAFNAKSKNWKLLELRGQPPEARILHAATLYGTKMYVYGGYGTGNRYLGDLWIAELSDYSAQSWSQPQIRGTAPSGRTQTSLCVLNGLLVIFGGNTMQRRACRDTEVYIPELNSWHMRNSSVVRVKGNPPKFTRSHRGLSVSDGILYFTTSGIHKLSQQNVLKRWPRISYALKGES